MDETLALAEQGELWTLELTEEQRAERGRYDASRTPEAVQRLVAFLLAVPGMRWDRVAKIAGIAWETVAAIARSRAESIREWKDRIAGELRLVVEAGIPGLMEKAREGKLSAFDLKLIGEMWSLLAGEATSRHEVLVRPTPELEEMRRLLGGAEMGLPGPGNSAHGRVLEAAAVVAPKATGA